jgi:uncharacterized protein
MTDPNPGKALQAAHQGDLQAVKGWLEEGGDLEARNDMGFTLLLAALEGKQTALASWLLDRGANVHARLESGFSALHILTKHFRNRPRAFQVTVTRDGQEVTATDKADVRRLVGSHPDDEHDALLACVGKLLERGFDVSVTSGAKRTPPLRYAAEVDEALAMFLLRQAKPEVNAADSEGFTALHMAGRFGHLQLAEALLERGAAVDATDTSGFTPLHEAIMAGKKDVVVFLRKKGASVERAITTGYQSFQPGDAAAEIAKKSGHPELEALLEV